MNTESLLLSIVIQLAVIIGVARLIGTLFRFIGQPQVCGEIAAGVILGPTVFGALFPRLQHAVFDPAVSSYINILSQVGLVFVMFLIGIEFDFSHLRNTGRTAFVISSAGMLAPFGLGLALAPWIYSQMKVQVNPWSFALFVAMSLSITAMPVLGRIIIEFNMTRTRLGAVTMSAAAIGDAVGWLLLGFISATVAAASQPFHVVRAALGVVAYVAAMIVIVRPLLLRWIRWVMRDSKGEISLNALAQLIIFVFASGAVTYYLGIFFVFGAFTIGAVLYDQAEFRTAVNRRMLDFVTVFFLPVFFAFTGLRTDIRSVQGGLPWVILAVVVLAASVGKFGGCGIAARLCGLSWRESASIGIMMNTRGLMELIVLNAGYDLGIIPKSIFFIFVVMALVTTYSTAPVLRRLIPGTDAESSFNLSVFAQRQPGFKEMFLKGTGLKRTA